MLSRKLENIEREWRFPVRIDAVARFLFLFILSTTGVLGFLLGDYLHEFDTGFKPEREREQKQKENS